MSCSTAASRAARSRWTAGSSGGTGGASADCAVWQVQTALAGIAALNGVAVASPAIQVAVGTGAGQGQLLVPGAGVSASASSDGGLYPPDGGVCAPYDAGPARTWSVYPSIPPAGTLNGVWADLSGDVFAVGQDQARTGLLLAGNLDAGLLAVALDGGPLALSLTSVLGLGPAKRWPAASPRVGLRSCSTSFPTAASSASRCRRSSRAEPR